MSDVYYHENNFIGGQSFKYFPIDDIIAMFDKIAERPNVAKKSMGHYTLRYKLNFGNKHERRKARRILKQSNRKLRKALLSELK